MLVVASTALLTGGLVLAYGRGVLGYDTAAALLWADDLAHGRQPVFQSLYSPTPHPLAYLGLVTVTPLGRSAAHVVEILSLVSFALLALAAFELGRTLFTPLVGAGFAALVLTRPMLVAEAERAFVDIPCLALILYAVALEARRPRRGWVVLGLLSLAGLLRPESWLLAGAYALWCMPGRSTRERALLLLGAASAPLIWAALDLLITGDPLFSLHNTSDAAAALSRPQGLSEALRLMPAYLADVVEAPVLWAGMAGFLLCLYLLYERSSTAGAVLVLGLLGFLVLGAADLPLLRRYLLPSGAMFGLFCIAALAAWRLTAAEGRARLAAGVVAAGAAIALIASVPSTVSELGDTRSLLARVDAAEEALLDLAWAPAARSAAERCPRLYVPDQRFGTALARPLGVGLRRIGVWSARLPDRRGLLVVPRRRSVAAFYVDSRRLRIPNRGELAGFTRVDGNDLWELWARC